MDVLVHSGDRIPNKISEEEKKARDKFRGNEVSLSCNMTTPDTGTDSRLKIKLNTVLSDFSSISALRPLPPTSAIRTEVPEVKCFNIPDT